MRNRFCEALAVRAVHAYAIASAFVEEVHITALVIRSFFPQGRRP